MSWSLQLHGETGVVQACRKRMARDGSDIYSSRLCLPDNCTRRVFGRMLAYRLSALELT